MVQAKISKVYEQMMLHTDDVERMTPMVSVSFTEAGGEIAGVAYPLRKNSAIETIEDVLVLVKGEIERLGKTTVVGTTKDKSGNDKDVLERDMIIAGSNVEGTQDKNIQVELKDLQKHKDSIITKDTQLDDIDAVKG